MTIPAYPCNTNPDLAKEVGGSFPSPAFQGQQSVGGSCSRVSEEATATERLVAENQVLRERVNRLEAGKEIVLAALRSSNAMCAAFSKTVEDLETSPLDQQSEKVDQSIGASGPPGSSRNQAFTASEQRESVEESVDNVFAAVADETSSEESVIHGSKSEEAEQLRAEVNSLQAELLEARCELDSVRSGLDEHKNHMLQAMQQWELSGQSESRLRTRVKELESSNGFLEDQIVKFTVRLNDVEAQNEALLLQLNAESDMCNYYQENWDAKITEVEALQSTLEDMSNERGSHIESMSGLHSAMADVLEKRQRLEERLNVAEQEARRLVGANIALEEEKKDLCEVVEEKNNRIVSLEEVLASLESEVKTECERAYTLHAELWKEREEAEELKKECKESNEIILALEHTLGSVEAEWEESRNRSSAKNKAMQKSMDRLNKEKEELAAELESVRETNNMGARKLADVEVQVTALEFQAEEGNFQAEMEAAVDMESMGFVKQPQLAVLETQASQQSLEVSPVAATTLEIASPGMAAGCLEAVKEQTMERNEKAQPEAEQVVSQNASMESMASSESERVAAVAWETASVTMQQELTEMAGESLEEEEASTVPSEEAEGVAGEDPEQSAWGDFMAVLGMANAWTLGDSIF